MSDSFKIPVSIPQDLLLIHDIVATTETITTPTNHRLQVVSSRGAEAIDSSDEEHNSEDEIEADLLLPEVLEPKIVVVSSSESGSSSSSDSESTSDSESEDETKVPKHKLPDLDADDEEDSGPAPSNSYHRTQNEVLAPDISVPDIQQVGPDETLERVGEIMSIIDKVVIVKGLPSELMRRGSERALDSDTLLVFEDRTVMGYIHETFGPTTQPLYQVRFSEAYPLDPENVRISRAAFHVPERSRFVFLNAIKNYRGSDASNVHDEEPADDELEFSDDEAEAAFKSKRKRKRGTDSQSNSVMSSRHGTPAPSHMRDRDMSEFSPGGSNPFAEHGPYDTDYASSSSRPMPIPYDDPYADDVSGPTVETSKDSSSREEQLAGILNSRLSQPERPPRGRGRGRDHEGMGAELYQPRELDERGGRGRGRGRGEGGRDHHGHRSYQGSGRGRGSRQDQRSNVDNQYAPPWPTSPSSPATAHATDQHFNGFHYGSNHLVPPFSVYDTPNPWTNSLQTPPSYQAYQQPYIQPHINPRFASAFGMNLNFVQAPAQPYVYYPTPNAAASQWTTVNGNVNADWVNTSAAIPEHEQSPDPTE